MEKKEGIVFVIENHKTWQLKILLHEPSTKNITHVIGNINIG